MISEKTAEGVFLNLVRLMINNKKPSALPDGITADDIFEIGSKQDMAPITFCALNTISPKPYSARWTEYQKRFFDDCMRSEVQMSEYKKLVAYLCRNGVKVLPLKGCVIKDLYPVPYFRVMSDVDLLYEGVTPKELARLMEKAGYTTESLKCGCHEVFHKLPCMNIEPHRKLVADDSPYKAVLENMFEKAVPDENIRNLYHMKPEDLYIHVIIHAAKHFLESGLGVRPILDFYVLNQKYSADWDSEYIEKQVASVGLSKFEKKMREVAYAFFGDEKMEVSVDMKEFFKGSTYGVCSEVGRDYMSKGGNSRIGFFLHRTFLPYSVMCEKFPILKKCPVLLPFIWLYRIIDILLHKRRNVAKVAKADISRENAEQIKKTIQQFGLDCL
ncbi:MAG: nucleotidyltransferase family protein [Lachnospiraceae bacterium]|nr:nucleotidyltransferase family protein [Lachnospiraceae bacterium]